MDFESSVCLPEGDLWVLKENLAYKLGDLRGRWLTGGCCCPWVCHRRTQIQPPRTDWSPWAQRWCSCTLLLLCCQSAAWSAHAQTLCPLRNHRSPHWLSGGQNPIFSSSWECDPSLTATKVCLMQRRSLWGYLSMHSACTRSQICRNAHHDCVVDVDKARVLAQIHGVGVVAQLLHSPEVHHKICTQYLPLDYVKLDDTRPSMRMQMVPICLAWPVYEACKILTISWGMHLMPPVEQHWCKCTREREMTRYKGDWGTDLCHRGMVAARARSHTPRPRRRSLCCTGWLCAARPAGSPAESAHKPACQLIWCYPELCWVWCKLGEFHTLTTAA